MSHKHQPSWRSCLTISGRSAEIGIVLVCAYAMTFLVYAVLRSAATLLATPDIDAGWFGTTLATWTALAIPASVFAALFVPLVALLGALTGLIVYTVSPVLNPGHAHRRAIVIGIGVCSLVAVTFVLLLGPGAGLQWTAASSEALTFWLALPLLIYIIAGGAASWRLNQLLDDDWR